MSGWQQVEPDELLDRLPCPTRRQIRAWDQHLRRGGSVSQELVEPSLRNAIALAIVRRIHELGPDDSSPLGEYAMARVREALEQE